MQSRRNSLVALALMALTVTLACATTSTAREGAEKGLRRTILLQFTPQTTPAEIASILADSRKAISDIEGLTDIYIGPQVNEISDFTHGISMDFDDEAALKRYRSSPKRKDAHNRWVHRIAESQITDLRNP